MENLLKKVENTIGEESIEVIKSWMEAYSLELRKLNDSYVVYSVAFEPEEKIADISNEEDFINLVAEHIEIYAQEDLSYDELLNIDDDYKLITGSHLEIIKKIKSGKCKDKNVKLLDKKAVFIKDKECMIEMYLNEIIPSENIIEYAFNVEMPKDIDLGNNEIKVITDKCTEMFEGLKDKKAIYIPSIFEINEYGDGYIDAYYELDLMQKGLDDGYVTEDEEVGKMLLYIGEDCDNKNDSTLKLEIRVTSLSVVDENNNITSLWDLDNGSVFKFLASEIIENIK